MRDSWRGKLLSALHFFGVLFFISSVLTASFMLFFTGMEIDERAVRGSAFVTFGNAVFIAFLVWLVGKLRRRITVDRPIRQISEGLQKMTAGDLSERIKPIADPLGGDKYNIIIEQINKMADELSGVETLRTDFVSNVSHEMKTPLAVIQNYAALLRSPGLSDDDRIAYAEAISASSARLSALITNVLKLNKLENQQIYPEAKRFDLGEQICECLLPFENEWERKQIGIETDIAEDISITADPELLGLVWSNLFSNALKFTDAGGTVGVRVARAHDLVTVSVWDTGCGIDSRTGRHIFDKFYQGDTSHAAKGNGLGLALVKRIIDITGGEITVNSELGKGSTFTVAIRDTENGAFENAGG